MNDLVCYEPGFDLGDWLTLFTLFWLSVMIGWRARETWAVWQEGSRIRDEIRRG